jgi:4-amino-4-deoxy-L-arabinose transferase-like glycosyltransferase
LSLPSFFLNPKSVFRPTQAVILIAMVSIAVRLIWINQPYIDNWSWRQSDVAAVARNFYDQGFHFAHPQIDWAGDQPGYVGTEFPILPFAAALCYKLVGVHDWVGRIETVIFFAVSLPFFFLLVREIADSELAAWATFFYSFAPLSVFTGRVFMPDVPSLSLSIIGLYYFIRWLNPDAVVRPARGRKNSAAFICSAICVCLSILVKLPSAIIGAPLACVAFRHFGWSALRDWRLWLFAMIALLPSLVWYGHAYQVALNFYPHHFFGAGGIRVMPVAWYVRILREIVLSSLSIPLVVLAMIGGILNGTSNGIRLFRCWLAAMVMFIVVVGYGNRHQWYQLPLIPIAAAFAGIACKYLTKITPSRGLSFGLAAAVVVVFCAASFIAVKPLYHSPASAALRDLGLALKTTTPQASLIVAADNGDPTAFYYGERKGWHFLEKDGIPQGEPLTSQDAISDLEQLRQRGASYLAFPWATLWWLDYYKEFEQYVSANATIVQATPEYRIYKLNR